MSSLLVRLREMDADLPDGFYDDPVGTAEPGIILPPDALAGAFACAEYRPHPPVFTHPDRRLTGFTTSLALALWYAGRAVTWLYFRHWLAAIWLGICSAARSPRTAWLLGSLGWGGFLTLSAFLAWR